MAEEAKEQEQMKEIPLDNGKIPEGYVAVGMKTTCEYHGDISNDSEGIVFHEIDKDGKKVDIPAVICFKCCKDFILGGKVGKFGKIQVQPIVATKEDYEKMVAEVEKRKAEKAAAEEKGEKTE